MNIEHLLSSAQTLANSNQGRPRRTDLRRACSNIYYAMFHCLCEHVANQLAGRSRRNSKSWVIFYRHLGHGEAKKALMGRDVLNLDPAVSRFATHFKYMQEVRHTADYDPSPFTYTRNQVNGFKSQAEIAISDLQAVIVANADLHAEFAALLIQKSRT